MPPWNKSPAFRAADLDPVIGSRREVRYLHPHRSQNTEEFYRLLSNCATASETISSLTDDIKTSTTVLNSGSFHCLEVTEQTRLKREQNALVARREVEKAGYMGLRREMLAKMEMSVVKAEGKQFDEEGMGDQNCEGEQDDAQLPVENSEREQKDKRNRFEHDLVRSRTSRLGEQVAIMKSVLVEMHRMTINRAAQEHMRIGASPSENGSNKRKFKCEIDADADIGDKQARISLGPLHSALPTPCHTPASKHEVYAVRTTLEQCVHQFTDIHNNLCQNDADEAYVAADLLQVALDELRIDIAKSVQERQAEDAAEQAELHAEVTRELAQVTQEMISLDMQVGEVTGTLNGLVLHVDELEETVEQERRRKDETRVRMEQMKTKFKSYEALQAQNAVAVSTLRNALDAYMPPSTHTSTSGSPIPTLSPIMSSIYATSQDMVQPLASTMTDAAADAAYPLVESTRSEVASIVQQTRIMMLQTFDLRMAKALDAVEELATKRMSCPATPEPEMHVQDRAAPFVLNESHDDQSNIVVQALPVSSLISSHSILPTSCAPSPSAIPSSDRQLLPCPVIRTHSAASLRYTPPPEDNVTPVFLNNPSVNASVSPPRSLDIREISPVLDGSQADIDSSLILDIPSPKTGTPSPFDLPPPAGKAEEPSRRRKKTTVSQQLGCSFLTDPSLQGIPIWLQPRDIQSRVCRPFAFVRIVPASESNAKESDARADETNSTTTVEVRDCRKGSHSGNLYQFPLDALCYVPPTAKHQTAVCAAPGPSTDAAQEYYILQFDVGGRGDSRQCVVRKDPKVPGAELISFPTRLLAQVAPPIFASRISAFLPAAFASESSHASSLSGVPAAAEGTKKLTIKNRPRVKAPAMTRPKVHFDHPPPMWLKDPVFTGYRVQLKEQDGDGSILELVSVDSTTSTVEVQPLLTSAPRRSISLEDVRHVTACAPYQIVVAIAGDLKGIIMKMGTYGKEECTLYAASGRRSCWSTHLERTYKTAHLAVILPPRK